MNPPEDNEVRVSEEAKPEISSPEGNIPPEPERHKNAKVILIVSFILLIAAIGVLSFLLVKDSNTQIQKMPEQNIQETSSETVKEDPSDTNAAMSSYKNDEYGFEFEYPEEWGEPSFDVSAGETGQLLFGKFPNKKDINFAVQTKDYMPYGRDGGCGVYLVVMFDATSYDYVLEASDEVINGDEKGFDYRIIKQKAFSDDNTAINKSFEAGSADVVGACPGFSSIAVTKFSDDANVEGVKFFFGTRDNSTDGVPYQWAEDYLKDPTYYYNTLDFDQYVEMVKSTKSL